MCHSSSFCMLCMFSKMEFANTITKFHISQYVSLLVVVFSIATTTTTVLCDDDFPAIFNFGDSNSDTGGMAATTLLYMGPPYGETYFHRPTGRPSDGRLIIDFIAQSFGLPYLSAYLNSMGSNFSHGANFATVSASITLPTSVLPQGTYSPFYLDIQYTQFEEFKAKARLIRDQGGIFASLMPKEEDFAKALYTFDIGHNDLNIAFMGNMTIEQVNAFIPDIISSFKENIKNIYNTGARSYNIHNAGPIGCLPYILTQFLSAERDIYGCAKLYNDLTQNFNHELKDAVVQLREDFPLATFTYVDIYSIKHSLFTNPKEYGFEYPLVACCGYGGAYNFNDIYTCGSTIDVNGTQGFVGSCENPSVRVIWDGYHFTEAANKFVSYQISTGDFSDSSPHLNMEGRQDSTTKNYY